LLWTLLLLLTGSRPVVLLVHGLTLGGGASTTRSAAASTFDPSASRGSSHSSGGLEPPLLRLALLSTPEEPGPSVGCCCCCGSRGPSRSSSAVRHEPTRVDILPRAARAVRSGVGTWCSRSVRRRPHPRPNYFWGGGFCCWTSSRAASCYPRAKFCCCLPPGSLVFRLNKSRARSPGEQRAHSCFR